MSEKIKILIVDDSLIFRSAIAESLSNADDVKVIGSVRNGTKAIEFIRNRRPDIVTLDVEMPEMNGLTTLREIQSINASTPNEDPIVVIMLSALTQKGAESTIEALSIGAIDVVAKPQSSNVTENIDSIGRQLLTIIRQFNTRTFSSKTRIKQQKSLVADEFNLNSSEVSSEIEAIVIGVSTGGPRALNDMLPGLCDETDLPIFIVQHMPPTFTEPLAKSLNKKCSAEVIEASDNTVVQTGHVYIAPGGQHMLLKRINGNVLTTLNDQPEENGCRPAVDILFRSAASVYDSNVLVLILTGMGNDGTKGIATLKRKGAFVIAQDEESSVVWGMPGTAVNAGNVDKVLPLMQIPEAVANIINQPAL